MYSTQPGMMPAVERIRLLADGFAGLRDGAKYMLFGVLFEVIGVLFLIPGLLGEGATAIGGSVSSVVLIIVGAIASILGLVKWKSSGSLFKQFDYNLRHAESGPKYMLYALPLVIIALLVIVQGLMGDSMGVVAVGYLLLFIAGILALVGYILFGLFLIRIGEASVEGVRIPDFKVDGILWIVGIIFGILALIAVILIYMHSKEAENSLRMYRPQPQPEPLT